MSHLAKVKTTWHDNDSISLVQWQQFSSNIACAINGTTGGAWAPSSTLNIAGSGLNITGPTVVFGVDGTIQTLGGARFVLTAGWPLLGPGHAGKTQVRVSSCMWATGYPDYGIRRRADLGGIQTNVCTLLQLDTSGNVVSTQPVEFYAPLAVMDNAQILSVEVHWRVVTPRTSLPTAMPKIRVLGKAGNGADVILSKTAPGADANGYVSVPAPASAAAWYDNGNDQSIVIPCDITQLVNLTGYTYVIDVLEEQNALVSPWVFYVTPPVDIVYDTNQAQTGATSIPTGNRALCIGQTVGSQNGIFTTQSGAWPRAGDLSTTAPFTYTKSLIVPVKTNGQNIYGYGGVFFQLGGFDSRATNLTIGTDSIGFFRETIQGADYMGVLPPGSTTIGFGNVWTGIKTTMAIADLRYGQS